MSRRSNIEWWKVVIAMLGIWAANAIARPAYEDYSAVYRIYAPRSDRQIGNYAVQLKWVSEKQLYQLKGKIELDYRALLTKHAYRYTDEVWFDSHNDVSFESDEVDNGRNARIQGKREMTEGGLMITKQESSGAALTHRFSRGEYDFTTFALRFPTVCSPTTIGKKIEARLLDPVSLRIDQVSSEYIGYGPAQLTNLHGVKSPLCLVTNRASRKELNRRSWISPDGYLVYEESPAYSLVLDSSRSVLPPQTRKGTP